MEMEAVQLVALGCAAATGVVALAVQLRRCFGRFAFRQVATSLSACVLTP
jgi:hypothetical protein